MQVVILAGGLGTRLAEETSVKPKPMVEIGGMPILWHIMKVYSKFGYNDFIICLGYKGYIIKEYFANYFLHKSNVTISLVDNSIQVHDSQAEPLKITLVDTGNDSMTGGRIKRIEKYTNGETFMLTYGDGVADVNFKELLSFHRSHGRLATLTSVQIPGRFGSLEINESGEVASFIEKPVGDGMWINGGFFVLEPGVFKYLSKDVEDIQWEKEPLDRISKDNQLAAYKHYGFWKCMDALRDRVELEEMWNSNNARWKTW